MVEKTHQRFRSLYMKFGANSAEATDMAEQFTSFEPKQQVALLTLLEGVEELIREAIADSEDKLIKLIEN